MRDRVPTRPARYLGPNMKEIEILVREQKAADDTCSTTRSLRLFVIFGVAIVRNLEQFSYLWRATQIRDVQAPARGFVACLLLGCVEGAEDAWSSLRFDAFLTAGLSWKLKIVLRARLENLREDRGLVNIALKEQGTE